MKGPDFSRYALSSCVAAAMLTGCGGSSAPIGVPGAMPRNPARFSPRSRVIDVNGTLYCTTSSGGANSPYHFRWVCLRRAATGVLGRIWLT